jgi:hypothetical protein
MRAVRLGILHSPFCDQCGAGDGINEIRRRKECAPGAAASPRNDKTTFSADAISFAA